MIWSLLGVNGIAWFIRLFYVSSPRRETGVTNMWNGLVLTWFGLVLLLFGCCLDPIGEVSSGVFAVGEFLTRTAILSQAIPAIWVWCSIHNRPIPKYYGVRHGKKRRRKKEPWFGRRRRARWRARVSQKVQEPRAAQATASSPDDTPIDIDISMLHYADYFAELCKINPRLIDVILAAATGLFTDNHREIYDWGFLDVGETLDTVADGLVLPSRVLGACMRFQAAYLSQYGEIPVVYDTGATISVSPCESDFISWEARGDDLKTRLKGINSSASVLGVGIVRWTIRDDRGRQFKLETKAYYVPEARVRLLSPQRFFHEQGQNAGGQFTITSEGAVFTFPGPQRRKLTFRMWDDSTGRSSLPVAYIVPPPTDLETKVDEAYSALSVLDDANINLTLAQKELMLWHFKLGHFHLEWIQRLMRVREGEDEPVLRTKHKANACQLPHCAACHFAKLHLRATESTVEKTVKAREGILKTEHLKPGDMVSTDQYVSKLPGRLPHTKGKEKDKERYQGGTIYVDEASGFIFAQHQVSLNAAETIRGKHLFEREALTCGREIKNYRGDNGVFKTKEFINDLEQRRQTIRYSGVGAHHQNGIAERAIRTISESARAMLLHAAIHWPQQVNLDLWPFAMDYAVYLWNRMPRKDTGIAPIEIFCGTKLDPKVLRTTHVWGCPAYVLDPKIQDGKKLPRWEPKSRRGQFLGMSKRHASTIGLIRNLRTGSVSAQFHVVYDDSFTTIPSDVNDEDMSQPPDNWIDLLTFSRMKVFDDDDAEKLELHDEWLSERDLERRHENRQRRNQAPQRVIRVDEEDQEPEDEIEAPPLGDPDEDDNDDDEDNEQGGDNYWQPRHERRRWAPNPRYFGSDFQNRLNLDHNGGLAELLNDFGLLTEDEAFLASLGTKEVETSDSQLSQMAVLEGLQTDEEGLLTTLHPLAFAAKANNDDTPNFYQAMNGPDAEGFYQAMGKEMEQLESKDPWDIIPISDVPEGANILDSVWAFKRKRFPDGLVRKLKARWCVRGDQQIEGVDFFDTYAPVVAWSTVRLLLILSVTLGLATKQVDYTLAFVQADLDEDVYVRMPKLFEKPGHVYKLKKSVYGLRQAPLNFFLSLKEGLEARGFVQSEHDPCLFVSEKVICLCYVDDCLFYAVNESDIDAVIESLRRPEPTTFDLNIENDVAGFLGILIEKQPDGSIELKQTGLIDRILKVMGLEDSSPKSTPSETKGLGKDEKGEPCSEPWSYSSVVGMMMYLSSNSRPDIAYAVHSCARFTHCPKRSHEKALKRIARYLKGTRTRGMVIRPKPDLSMDLYADSDFAGLWSSEDPNDSTSVKSRTGYILTLGGTPVLWASKLQSLIALSTAEAEYISLSTAMRALLPVRALFHSLAETLTIPHDEITKVCAVWEDNNAALKMATSDFPNMTPRTKHIAIHYHWFKQFIGDKIQVKRIDTTVQKADIFTKGLAKKDFEDKRKMILGW